ncbi:MAG: hypothetical protein ACJ72S_08455 [Nitrososphaeraceae archaeon]
MDKPLYDYQKIIFDLLIASSSVIESGNINPNKKHLWIKKATGLGISEFMFRFMAWLRLKDNALSGSQTCIVTGPSRLIVGNKVPDYCFNCGYTFYNCRYILYSLDGIRTDSLEYIYSV